MVHIFSPLTNLQINYSGKEKIAVNRVTQITKTGKNTQNGIQYFFDGVIIFSLMHLSNSRKKAIIL